MRAALAIAVATLTLGLTSQPMDAQMRAGDVPVLDAIHMLDRQTGWAITHEPDANTLVRTTDGGRHWKMSIRGTWISVNNLAVLTSHIAWVGLFRTVDGGQTWTKATVFPAQGVAWMDSIYFANARDGWALSVQGANMASVEVGVYRSTDGGGTWVRATEHSRLDLGSKTLTFLNSTTGWVTGPDWAYPYTTRDAGRTWKVQKLPLPPQVKSPWGSGIMPPKFFTARNGVLSVFYTNRDPQQNISHPLAPFVVVYVTHDGGSTWMYTTPLTVTNQTGYVDVRFVDVNHGWIANGNDLYATSDGGRGWTTIRPNQLFADVKQIDFISSQIGWARRQSVPYLLKTEDGGRTWAPVSYKILRW